MWLIHNIFSRSILDQVEGQFSTIRGWYYADSTWDKELLKGFAANSIELYELGQSFSQYLVRESVHRHCAILKIKDSINTRYRAQLVKFHQGSGINSHYDSHYSWAATIYLNRQWDRLSGGWFQCSDFIHVPCYNSMVINADRESHSVSRVYSNEPRITLQIWAVS